MRSRIQSAFMVLVDIYFVKHETMQVNLLQQLLCNSFHTLAMRWRCPIGYIFLPKTYLGKEIHLPKKIIEEKKMMKIGKMTQEFTKHNNIEFTKHNNIVQNNKIGKKCPKFRLVTRDNFMFPILERNARSCTRNRVLYT